MGNVLRNVVIDLRSSNPVGEGQLAICVNVDDGKLYLEPNTTPQLKVGDLIIYFGQKSGEYLFMKHRDHRYKIVTIGDIVKNIAQVGDRTTRFKGEIKIDKAHKCKVGQRLLISLGDNNECDEVIANVTNLLKEFEEWLKKSRWEKAMLGLVEKLKSKMIPIDTNSGNSY